MTRASRSPSTTRSRTRTMFGWVSRSSTERSRRKRITMSGSLASSSFRTLIATVSPGCPGTAASAPAVSRWRARQTVPVAPRPSGSSSRYLLPTGRTSRAPCWLLSLACRCVRSRCPEARCPGVPPHCSAVLRGTTPAFPGIPGACGTGFDGKTRAAVLRLPGAGRDRSQLIAGGVRVRHFWGQSRPIKITCHRVPGALPTAGARMPPAVRRDGSGGRWPTCSCGVGEVRARADPRRRDR